MELSEITMVEDLCNPDKVNKYLALGWKIISHYTSSYDTEGPGCYYQTQHYVMAWYGPDPKYPPKPTYPGLIEI